MVVMKVASAAPATPIGRCVSHPKMRNGAKIMFKSTVADWTIIPGLKLPVPRSAAAIATMANCKAVAGRNHSRYWPARRAVSALALSLLTYSVRAAIATMKNKTPTSIDSSCDWLKSKSARWCSLRPAACEIKVVVPTPSIWVIASTTNMRLPATPTPATASLPRRPTQKRSTRK